MMLPSWVLQKLDIAHLLRIAIAGGIPFPEELNDAVILTSYAAAGRYPSFHSFITKGEYDRALIIAEQVIIWAENHILRK